MDEQATSGVFLLGQFLYFTYSFTEVKALQFKL